jgi:hypothetical protein
MTTIAPFLRALALTIAIETAVVILMVRFLYRLNPKELSWKRLLLASCFASFATLPYLWFVLPELFGNFLRLSLIGETGVVIIEGLFYRAVFPLTASKCFVLSLCANGVSFLAGILLPHAWL